MMKAFARKTRLAVALAASLIVAGIVPAAGSAFAAAPRVGHSAAPMCGFVVVAQFSSSGDPNTKLLYNACTQQIEEYLGSTVGIFDYGTLWQYYSGSWHDEVDGSQQLGQHTTYGPYSTYCGNLVHIDFSAYFSSDGSQYAHTQVPSPSWRVPGC